MSQAANPFADRPSVLMCPPEYYGIQYEINPWMDRRRQADHREATRQWERLRDLIQEAGATVYLMDPVPGLPDLVFTANAGLVYRDQVILSNFRYRERARERPYQKRWFQQHGFRTVDLPEPYHFEGAGDALFCGPTLFGGYRIRSHAAGHQWIGRRLGCQVIPVELVNPFYYHLDTCFCPLAPGLAIYFPDAFDQYGRRALRAHVAELIPVHVEEARRFACNAVVIGRRVITNTGCPRLHRALRERGWEPVETPLDEFVKAGGSAKCLTLRLDGEEAAAWRREG